MSSFTSPILLFLENCQMPLVWIVFHILKSCFILYVVIILTPFPLFLSILLPSNTYKRKSLHLNLSLGLTDYYHILKDQEIYNKCRLLSPVLTPNYYRWICQGLCPLNHPAAIGPGRMPDAPIEVASS